MENVQYLSPAWAHAVEQALAKSPMGNFTAAATFYHHRTPSGKDQYLYLSYRNGAFERLMLGEGNGPEATFCLSGDYAVYAEVLRGTMDASRAISTGRLKLKGNLLQIMRLTPFIHVLTDALSAVPTSF